MSSLMKSPDKLPPAVLRANLQAIQDWLYQQPPARSTVAFYGQHLDELMVPVSVLHKALKRLKAFLSFLVGLKDSTSWMRKAYDNPVSNTPLPAPSKEVVATSGTSATLLAHSLSLSPTKKKRNKRIPKLTAS